MLPVSWVPVQRPPTNRRGCPRRCWCWCVPRSGASCSWLRQARTRSVRPGHATQPGKAIPSEVHRTIQKALAPRPNRARLGNISQRMRSRSTISSAVFLQEFAAVRFHPWEAIPERFEFLSSFPRCDAPLGTHFLVNDSAGPSMQVRNAAPSHSYIVMLHNLVTQHGNTLET